MSYVIIGFGNIGQVHENSWGRLILKDRVKFD